MTEILLETRFPSGRDTNAYTYRLAKAPKRRYVTERRDML